MSFNDELVRRFGQHAKLLELTGANRFKVNAYAKAARVIDGMTADLEPIAEDAKALTGLEGIGKGIAADVGELKRTGSIADLDALVDEVPSGLLRVLEVPGLGPKTVGALWNELGVTDVDGLRGVIESGEILKLPRMGEKAAAKLKESLRFAEAAGRRLHVGIARPVAEAIVERMGKVKGVERVAYAGSLRRGKETIGDIDVLVVSGDPAGAHRAFTEHEDVVQVIGSGETKSSVRLRIPNNFGRWRGMAAEDEPTVQADLRVVPAESWGAALMYFTGSKEHNVALRERARKRGLTLNEYGLFPDEEGAEGSPQSRGVGAVASATEKEIYGALEVSVIPPEVREDAGELRGDVPELIEVGDIKAELHAHTTASDGQLELEELVEAAAGRGFHTIAVTDHSRSSAQARGLDVARLEEQRAAIERLRGERGDVAVLCGSEVDILADGALDFDDETLVALDVVVASPHVALGQDPATATKRLIRAIEHPLVHVLGHPTGRIIGRRKGLEPAMDEIIAAAKEHNVALEINSHWLRLDLRDTHVRAAVEAGCLIAIDCDVHVREDFDNIGYGVATGRRGWLTAEQCVNCWPAERLGDWLASKR